MKKDLLSSFLVFLILACLLKLNAQGLVPEETSVVDCTCPGNLILNPSFESVSSGSNLASWTTTAGSAIRVQGTLVPSCNNLAVCGTYVGAIGNPSGSYTGAGTSSAIQEVSITAGAAYNFSVYAGRTDPNCAPTIKLFFLNASNASTGTTQTISVTKNAYIDCGLQNYTLSGNAPSGTTKIRIELRTTCGYLKVDAICLTSCKYAGIDGNTSICENSSTTINLNNLITGENTGGTWTKIAGTGSVSTSGTFTPAINGGASTVTCKYTVTGFSNGASGGTCTDESIVTINISEENQVGQNKEITICDSDLSGIDLFSKLDAGYTSGGVWSMPNGSMGSLNGSIFTPVAGNYSTILTYSVPANGTCPAKSVTVTIIVKPKADAGTDGTYEVCDNALVEINLNDYITGEQASGTWTIGGNPVSNMYTPTGSVIATYTVTGTAPCANDESIVTITVTPKADAGTDKTYEVCDNAITQIDLNDILTDEQSGGSWTMNGNPISNLYTPTTGTVVLTYTITGTNPCANDESTVTVTVYPNSIMVDAGPDGEVCAHAAATGLPIKTYQLAGVIGGGAISATWSDNGAGGSFDDANSLTAIYTPPVGVNTITLTLTTNDPAGPCGPQSDFLILKEIACAGILDPCTCNQVTYNSTEVMEVKDFIEIDGNPGDVWRITVNGGGSNAANGGLPYGTMQQLDPAGLVTTNIDFPIGTIIPEISAGLFKLDFAHDSGIGYTVTVRNDATGQELSISNYCIITTFTPNFSISSTICNNAAPINLAETITDGTPGDGTGTVDYYYINNLGVEVPITTAFNPADYPVGGVVQIFGRYTPNNVIDCEIIKQASNQITVTNCALPLDLLSFAGKTNNNAIVLNWKTANERDFSHYEVQKSADALEFASVGSVFSNKGNFYNFIDNTPNPQNNYYRLKLVNNDGSFNFSQTINVNFEKSKSFVNVENPSKNGEFTISTGLKNPSFTVLNSTGTKIEASTISNGVNKYVVKPININAGMYFLNIVSEGKIITRKVIVP